MLIANETDVVVYDAAPEVESVWDMCSYCSSSNSRCLKCVSGEQRNNNNNSNRDDGDVMTNCIEAAKNGDLYRLQRISAEHGVKVFNTSDDNPEGYFALYWAACKGHVDVCQYLVHQGADLNKTLHTGSTSLHAAADRGQYACARELVQG